MQGTDLDRKPGSASGTCDGSMQGTDLDRKPGPVSVRCVLRLDKLASFVLDRLSPNEVML